ncbi:MAG: flagellar basal body rod protein FlgB [Planctomycetaceae bacterium]|nr:flagellar basal body rod protein FlgB [Planctomycetaceae bacterium]
MGLLNQQFDLLTRLLAASEQRQQVISHNIANVNTPKYQRLDLKFEELLAREFESEKRGHTVTRSTPQLQHTPGLQARPDGNNVDIDMEIGQLNKNALLQQVYLQLMSTELGQMRRAMKS